MVVTGVHIDAVGRRATEFDKQIHAKAEAMKTPDAALWDAWPPAKAYSSNRQKKPRRTEGVAALSQRGLPPPIDQYFQRTPSANERLISVLPKLNMSGPPASANA